MIQNQAINKIIATQDKNFIIENNLDITLFSDYKEEFQWILDYMDKYDSIPDRATFIGKFSDFQLLEVSVSNDYILDELYKDRETRILTDSYNDMRKLLLAGKIEEATALAQKTSENLIHSTSIEAVNLLEDESRFNEYVEKKNNISDYFVTTGLKELDAVIGGWDRKEEYATIVARTNSGKCLEKGTRVIMEDGSLKKVEDIIVGDRIQSSDGCNTVLGLHNGTSHGWRIVPRSGKPFVVSDGHTLTLWVRNEIWDSTRKQMITDGSGTIVDMKVEEYLSKSNHYKRRCKLYRPSLEFKEKELAIDPYILGIWLGDGTAREPEITTMDSEVVDAIKEYATSIGCEMHICGNSGKASSYSIVGNSKFRNLLRAYDLINNKHIPDVYMISSREQRLQLLAGLLDSDGYMSGHDYEIVQNNKELSNSIGRLATGLGFTVSYSNKYVKSVDKNYQVIRIYGDFSSIPMRVERKKSDYVCKQNFLTSSFKVESVDSIEYYGFRCDGDERYLIEDGTLTHNTWLLLKSAIEAAKKGLVVGLYSGEMTPSKVGYRMDTLTSHISNSGLVRGRDEVFNDYKEYITKEMHNIKGKLWVISPKELGGIATVNTLRAFIKKYNLDMLCIDQHSLLEDQRGAKNPVDRASNISKDLKNLQVLTGIPIITVSQQNRTSTENGIDTTHIAQSDRIGQDSTTVIAFEQKDGVLTLSLIKARDSAAGTKLQYAIDFDKGDFKYIPEDESAEEALTEEFGDEPF